MSKQVKYNAFESFLYESRPFSLLLISGYAVSWPGNLMMATAGIALMICSAIILRLRLRHRGYIRW